jgi:MFS transporter, DHA2 family, methylenomycin A resistance protein
LASAVVNALRQVGQAFGVAVLGALVYAHLPGTRRPDGSIAPTRRRSFDGLHDALWVSGLALLAGAARAALLLTPGPRRAAG